VRLTLLLLLAGLFVQGAFPAQAQEVEIRPAALTRIVIAPPRSPVARLLRAQLREAYYGAENGTRAYEQAQKLYFFYGQRGFEPLWISVKGASVELAPNALRIVEVFKSAASEGLRPSDYLTPDLIKQNIGADPKDLVALETSFSAATARYAQDAYGGRVNPTAVSKMITLAPKRIDEATLLLKLAASADPAEVLLNLSPKHPEFQRLKAALAQFEEAELTVSRLKIPDGPTLKLGMQDARVPSLRERLSVEAPELPEGATSAAADINYDQPLVEAVKAFQEGAGINADGVLGPATLAALNAPSAVTRDDIVANMERWRWEPESLGAFRVEVNIPQFQLSILRDEEIVHQTRVVVGRPSNQTPIFSDEIESVVVNPYWNVPASIAANEIKPKLLQNPNYLDGQNMELLSGSKVVNAAAVDWSTSNINAFRVRQKPGPGNALGRIKFLFPNSHDVYLHDTPAKSLFERAYRAYSHGCVRVLNPMAFAGALMATNPEVTQARLEALFGDNERWVSLKTHIPVHLMYFTIRVDPDGTVRSYGDVYGHNAKLIELLNVS
jgi:murein L,D-transpeptidase YcbB/YkuD